MDSRIDIEKIKENRKKEKAARKSVLILQIMPLIIVCFIVSFFVIRELTIDYCKDTLLSNEYDLLVSYNESLAEEIVDYTDIEWLVNYWNNNIDKLDVVYDDDDAFDIKYEKLMGICEEKYNVFDVVKLNPYEIEEEDQKLLAEEELEYFTLLFNSYKRKIDCKYLYFITVDDKEMHFLVNACNTNKEVRSNSDGGVFFPGRKKVMTEDEKYVINNVLNEVKSSPKFSEATVSNNYNVYTPVIVINKETGEEKIVGILGITVGPENIFKDFYFNTIIIIAVILFIFFITCILLFIILNKMLIVPIINIQSILNKFKNDKNLDHICNELDNIKLNNEIGDLSKDIKTICRELADYTKEITEMYAEKQLLSAELDTAASIQESALRKDFEEFTRNLDVDIYASMKPAKEVGGDFYGFMMLDDDHIALYIADVSGKGVPGALFMMKCKVLIDNDFHYIKEPVKLLAEINNKICEDNDAEMFVTVWLGIYELSTGILKTANAGHEYPIIKHADGTAEVIKDKHGMVIGGLEDSVYFPHEIKLEKGDMLFVYTDGVTEAENINEEMYGMERLEKTINDMKVSSCKGADVVLMKDIEKFNEDADQFDDITILIFKVN